MKKYFFLLPLLLFSVLNCQNKSVSVTQNTNIIAKAELWGYNKSCEFENNSIEHFPSFSFFIRVDSTFGKVKKAQLVLKSGAAIELVQQYRNIKPYGTSLVFVTEDMNLLTDNYEEGENVISDFLNSSYIFCLSNNGDSLHLNNAYQLRFMYLPNLRINDE